MSGDGKKLDLAVITNEVKMQVNNPEVQRALLTSVFKGFQPAVMVQAITEGMIRGFEFKDFLEKNIYAIPYGSGYSLVTSVDYARKIGMRSGIVGIDEPVYEDSGDTIISCSVTVHRRVDGYVGDYTAKVYFKEYTTGRNLWATKPRTMIAKVAEMHALRKACPEQLSQAYVEEEMIKEATPETVIDMGVYRAKIEATATIDELAKVWSSLPGNVKKELEGAKDEQKKKFTSEDEIDKREKGRKAHEKRIDEIDKKAKIGKHSPHHPDNLKKEEPIETVQILTDEEIDNIQ